MTRYIPALDPIPSGLAYYDGEHYHCYEARCMIVDASIEECGRLPHSDGHYTPILRCQCCGTLYFGVSTLEQHTAPVRKQPPTPKPDTQAQDAGIILPNLLTV